jgi:molybdopterin-binding protein
MKISARNALQGAITEIKRGPIMTEVTVDLGNSQSVVAVVTTTSSERLALDVGMAVHAVIKSTDIMIMSN